MALDACGIGLVSIQPVFTSAGLEACASAGQRILSHHTGRLDAQPLNLGLSRATPMGRHLAHMRNDFHPTKSFDAHEPAWSTEFLCARCKSLIMSGIIECSAVGVLTISAIFGEQVALIVVD